MIQRTQLHTYTEGECHFVSRQVPSWDFVSWRGFSFLVYGWLRRAVGRSEGI